MNPTSTKPYLLRAIYEWCTDNGFTPYVAVAVDKRTVVPPQYVKNGEIVLNISFTATQALKMDNDYVHFSARFAGVSRDIVIPVDNVIAIYAKENGQGMAFEPPKPRADEEVAEPTKAERTLAPVPEGMPADQSEASPDDEPPKKGGRPTLTRIK